MAFGKGSRSQASRAPPDVGAAEPPPYETIAGPSGSSAGSATTSDDFLDTVTHLRRERMQANAASMTHSTTEVDRVRDFLRYTLAVDYQCDLGASLSAHDRAHFSTMKCLLDDLATTSDEIAPSAEERTALAPYFYHALQEPCCLLDVPVGLVLDCLVRFFSHQNPYGDYKGCLHDLPLKEGVGRLARKLVTDREILIPRIIQQPDVRAKMFSASGGTERLYFKRLSGIEGATVLGKVKDCPTLPGSVWQEKQDPSYELSEFGQKYVNSKGAARKSAAQPGMTSSWAQQAQEGVQSMLRRRQALQSTWSWMCSWRRQPASGFGRQVVWKRTYYLPDFFQDRPDVNRWPRYTHG